MSKNDNDFDDIDMDGFDDIEGLDGDFDTAFPDESERGPVSVAKESFMSGLKDKILDRNNIKRLVETTLGKGYANGIDTYDILKKEGSEVFNKNQSEAKGLLRQGVEIAGASHPSIESNIPGWLKSSIREDESYSSNSDDEDDSELANNLSSVDKLLKFNKKLEREKFSRDKLNKVRSARELELKLKSSSAIAGGIQRLVNYQDRVTINYQRKSLEQNYRMIDLMSKSLSASTKYYEMSSELLGSVAHNTAMPDYVKMKGAEFIKQNIRNRIVENTVGTLSQGLAPITSKINETVSGAISGLGMFTDQLEDSEDMSATTLMGVMAGNAVGGWAGDKVNKGLGWASGKVKPYMDKIPLLKQGDDALKKYGNNPAMLVNTLLENGVGIDAIDDFLREFQLGPNLNAEIKTGFEELEDVSLFDKRTHRTINEIIPAYLSSMDRSLYKLSTGEDRGELKWSHFDGAMVSSSKNYTQMMDMGLKDGNINDVRYAVDKVLDQMGAMDLSGPAKQTLRRTLIKLMQNGLAFQPTKYANIKDWGKIDPVIASELTSFIKDSFGIVEDDKGVSRFDPNKDGLDKMGLVNEVHGDSAKDIKNYTGRLSTMTSVFGKEALIQNGIIHTNSDGEQEINQDLLNEYLLEADGKYTYEQETKLKVDRKAELDRKKEAMGKGFKGFIGGAKNKARGLFKKASGKGDQKVEVKDPVTGEITEIEVTYDELQAALSEESDRTSNLMGSMGEEKPGFLKSIFSPKSQDNPGWLTRKFGSRITSGSEKLEEIQTYLKSRSIEEITGDVKTKYDETFTKEKHEELKKFLQTDPTGKRFINGLKRLNEYKPKGVLSKVKSFMGSSVTNPLGSPAAAAMGSVTGFEPTGLGNSTGTEMSDEGTHVRLDVLNESALATQALLTELLEITMTLPHAIGGMGQAGMEDPVVRNRQSRLRQLSRWMGDRKNRITGYFGKKTAKPRGFLSSVGTVVGGIGSASWSGISLLGRGLRGTMGLSVKAGALATKAGWEAAKWAVPKAFGATKKLAGLGLKAGLGIAGKATETVGDIAKGGYNLAFKEKKSLGQGDIYRKDEPERILLKRKDLLSGRFIDTNTGKPVTSFKDITGPVEDDKGSQVITQDDYDIGLESGGESITGFVARRAGKATGIVAGLAGRVLSPIFKPYIWAYNKILGKNPLETTDAWVVGEDKPRLYARLLKDGEYSRGDGFVISSLDEIDGALYDSKGNTVITAGEFNDRLVLLKRDGKPLLKLGGQFLGNSRIASKVRNVLRPIGKMFKGAWNVVTSPFKLLGRLTKGLRGKSTAEEIQGMHTEILGEQLSIQYAILQTLKSKGKDGKKGKKGKDPDDPTSNSWQAIVGRRKRAREATLNDVVDKLDQMNDDSNTRLDQLTDAVDPKRSLMDKAKGLIGGVGGKALDMVKGAGGWIAGKFAATKVGAIAGKALGFMKANGLRQALWQGVRMAGAAVVGTIGVAGAALLAVGVVVGIGGYLLYKGYQTKQAKKSPLTYLRFAQYGIDPRDAKSVDAMIKLESVMSKHHKIIPGRNDEGTKTVRVDTSKIKPNEIFPIFGISDEDLEDESKAKELAKRGSELIKWLQHRFLMSYEASVNASLLSKGDDVLADVDEKTSGTKGLQYLEEVKRSLKVSVGSSTYRTPDKMFDARRPSPFEGGMFSTTDKLWADAGDVQEAYDNAETAFTKSAADTNITTKALGPMSAGKEREIMAMKEDTVLNVAADGTSNLLDINKGIEREGRGRNLRNKNGYVKGDKTSMAKTLKSLDVTSAIRYLAYGLSEMSLLKVEQLWMLESYLIDKQPYGSQFYEEVPDGLEKAYSIFRAKSNEHKSRIAIWYRDRFLVFFRTHIRALLNNGVKDLHNGFKQLKASSKRNQLTWLLHVSGEGGLDPWTVTSSPWDIPCNTDSSVVEPYMEQFEKALKDEVIKVDGAANATSKVSRKLTEAAAAAAPGAPGAKDVLAGAELLTNRDSVEADAKKKEGGFFGGIKSFFGGKKDKPLPTPNTPLVQSTPPVYTTGEGGPGYKPPKSPGRDVAVSALLLAMKESGITDPTEQAMLIAQVDEETGNFSRLEENLKYTTAKRMAQVWPSRFRGNEAYAQKLIDGGPEAIANSVYARKELGNLEPGDGWKYRGRGHIQLTGKANYAAASKRLGIDLVSNPDLLTTDPRIAALATIDYWKHRSGGKLRTLAQRGDLRAVTQLVNGGQTNAAVRASKFNYYKNNLDKFMSDAEQMAKTTELIENVSGDVPVATPLPVNTPTVTQSNLAAGTGNNVEPGNKSQRAGPTDTIPKEVEPVVAEITPVTPPSVKSQNTSETIKKEQFGSVKSNQSTAMRQEEEYNKQLVISDNSKSILDQQLLKLTSMDDTLKGILDNIVSFSKQQSNSVKQVKPSRSVSSAARNTGY